MVKSPTEAYDRSCAEATATYNLVHETAADTAMGRCALLVESWQRVAWEARTYRETNAARLARNNAQLDMFLKSL